jgi:hypothetical protein
MAADEATGAGDDHEIILGHSRAFHANREGFYPIFQRLARQSLTRPVDSPSALGCSFARLALFRQVAQ